MKKHFYSSFTFLLAMIMIVSSFAAVCVSAGSVNPFTDVVEGSYYYDSVMWAYANGITTGTTATKFAPDDTCTRGQVVTFLWRSAGEPEPETKENRFIDVKDTDYYYKPILWAVENGITNGTSEKMFSPAVTCTNAHILTFIWRAVGEPQKTGNGEWYDDAVNWAANSGMLDGTFEGTFAPSDNCPRANVVYYLCKYAEVYGNSKELSIFVNANGDNKTADGTPGKPFATIEAARDYIRTLNKSEYTGITVKIASGEYSVKSALTFSEKDSGTQSCPITYKGMGNTTVVGGIKLTAADFKKSEGGLTEYFPEEVREKIVSCDLKPLGISAERIQKLMEGYRYLDDIPFLSADGDRQMIAQYPNDWLHIAGAEVYDKQWRLTDTDAGGEEKAEYYRINYGDEHASTVQSWSEVLPVFVRARIYKLWCPDDSMVANIDKSNPIVDIYFTGGHEPAGGTIMYFYNVPEALDIPGEYIIDKDAILYYYPTETFSKAVLSLPMSEGLVRAEGADWLTFDGISFVTCLKDGLILNGDHVTLKNCTVAGVQDDGVLMSGNCNRIDGCTVHSIGEDGIDVDSGDFETLTGGECVITECDVYDCSTTNSNGYCITCGGVNLLVSHNDCHDSNFKGIHVQNGANVTVEYNEVWNMMLLSDDVGAISGDSLVNANVVFRKNYVHDIGPAGEAAKINEYNPDYKYMGSVAFYFDNGCSYMEVCNNVVSGCDDGFLSNGGRHNLCHNNLFADCHEWYVTFSHFIFHDKVKDDGTLEESSTSLPDYVHSDAWKKLNPDLASVKTTTVGVSPDDPLIWCAPAFNECYDNYIFYNKAERHFSNWGVRPYNIEQYVEVFSGEGINGEGSDVNPELISTYSSSRKGKTLEDIITEKSDIIGLTLDEFKTIGRTK